MVSWSHYGDCCSSVVSYSFDNVQRHTRKAAVYRSSSRHHVQVARIAVGRSSRTKEGKPSSKGAWPSLLSDRGSGFLFVIYNEFFGTLCRTSQSQEAIVRVPKTLLGKGGERLILKTMLNQAGPQKVSPHHLRSTSQEEVDLESLCLSRRSCVPVVMKHHVSVALLKL